MTSEMGERLRGIGYRLTRPRQEVLAVLQAAPGPLTAQEVATRAGTSLASTYRALGLLVQLGMVSESGDAGHQTGESVGSPRAEQHGGQLGGVSHEPGEPQAEARSRRYTLCLAAGHHHHFICRSCHAALDITSDALERALERAAAEIERGSGLRIESHDLTLRGECAACREVDRDGKEAS